MGFEKRSPGTAADWKTNVQDKLQKFSVIRRPELKPISEQKAENIFVAPLYSQTACCVPYIVS